MVFILFQSACIGDLAPLAAGDTVGGSAGGSGPLVPATMGDQIDFQLKPSRAFGE